MYWLQIEKDLVAKEGIIAHWWWASSFCGPIQRQLCEYIPLRLVVSYCSHLSQRMLNVYPFWDTKSHSKKDGKGRRTL